jgi:lysophospholipase L1-like esterase
MARTYPAYPRVHFVGDSFTVGLYATSNHEYRTLIKASLQALNPLTGSEAWTLIAADGAKMSDQAADTYGVFGRVRYDLLILAMGQNDINAGHSTAQFRSDTETCLNYVADNTTAQAIVVAVPFQPGWFGTVYAQFGDAYNAILQEEALERGFYYADSWKQCLTPAGLSAPPDVPVSASASDFYHPNNTGHLQLHNALWKDILPLVSGALRFETDSRTDVGGSRSDVGADRTAA